MMETAIEKKLLRQSTEGTPLSIYDCGITEYRPMLDIQLDLVEKRIAGEIENTILLLEHYPTVTLGANNTKNILLQTRENLADENIDIIDIRRGGGATAHNPGQLVIYPIISLTSLGLGISNYVRQLEGIGIELLKTLSISAERCKGLPGLWVGEKKIASLGVKVKRHITYHGMAINLSNDLSIFSNIIPCGIENVQMTSAERETQTPIDTEKTKQRLGDIIMALWA
ncbi:MAG: lipoyl(octanoyl) transferase LipB [Planctomycetes bacterium]|nr:lipoyl(octanoyl) transferase LipB [Planctomycetota bacterium]